MSRYRAIPVPMFGVHSATFRRPALPLPPRPCAKKIDNLCSSWKVAVTDEECALCHAGSMRAKLVVVERATRQGVVRRRTPDKCVNAKEVVNREMRPCCGGSKTVAVFEVVCALDGIQHPVHDCFVCQKYKEREEDERTQAGPSD